MTCMETTAHTCCIGGKQIPTNKLRAAALQLYVASEPALLLTPLGGTQGCVSLCFRASTMCSPQTRSFQSHPLPLFSALSRRTCEDDGRAPMYFKSCTTPQIQFRDNNDRQGDITLPYSPDRSPKVPKPCRKACCPIIFSTINGPTRTCPPYGVL